LHCIALHCIALHCIALHCIALHCIALHCIALHCIALHCIALHYITLHYITLLFSSHPIGAFQWAITSSITVTYVTYLAYTAKNAMLLKTGLNNVFLPTLFIVVNNIEQYCYTRFRLNNIVQYCWQVWTTWAAKHCLSLFSTTLLQAGVFCCVAGENPRLSAERWLTLFTWVRSETRIEPTNSEVKGACSDECATDAPQHSKSVLYQI
jgi:hypothetical protein